MNKKLSKITSIGLGIITGLYITYAAYAQDITQKPKSGIETVIADDCGCGEKNVYDNKTKNEKDTLVYSLKERIKNKTIEFDRIIQEGGRTFYISPEGRLFESVPCPSGDNGSLNHRYYEAFVIA
ncbi:hypothetical protein FJZ53_00890 [Candidatus Woesearchaeota archaeon]|nr:hypothetical protein [Candidatus Woesearchaeota archaeon]